jgi:hypothetical protein
VLLFYLHQHVAKGWGTFKNILEVVELIVIGLGGAKNGCKKRRGIATRRFHRKRRRKWQFFLSILIAYKLSILQGNPLKL